MVPAPFVPLAQLDREVEKAVKKLSKKEVVRVRHNVGSDWTGDPAIFFRVVLTDAASGEETLLEVADRIEATISDAVHPRENWGLIPYFSYRSQSEQADRSEPEWT